jgi:hypothetical protein
MRTNGQAEAPKIALSSSMWCSAHTTLKLLKTVRPLQNVTPPYCEVMCRLQSLKIKKYYIHLIKPLLKPFLHLELPKTGKNTQSSTTVTTHTTALSFPQFTTSVDKTSKEHKPVTAGEMLRDSNS